MLRKNKKFLLEGLSLDIRNAALSSSLAGTLLLLCSCTSSQLQTALPATVDEGRHLEAPALPDSESTASDTDIPEVVNTLPLLNLPEPVAEPDLYSVSVMNVPVRDLLFTVARDAAINIDIHPGIIGQVSLNAIDQTIPQILERLSQQIDIRWTFDENDNVLVEPDTAFWRTYEVDYVNVTRTAETSTDVATSITTAGGNNNSTANLSQTSNFDFWQSLADNVTALLTDLSSGDDDNLVTGDSVVASSESGLLNVRATARQHGEVQAFINLVQNRSLTQVLIEATVVEVNLSDTYQSGVDWTAIINNNELDFSFNQLVTGANLANSPTNILSIQGSGDSDDISATIRLLDQFGDLRVLSSPRIMALNNQPAMLRVVDNRIYFTIDVTPAVLGVNGNVTSPAIFTSNVETVPVGFVMTVTPQISDDDQVTLNVRPTISRIVRFVNDPNPVLADSGVVNAIPEIQVREMESVMKVFSGDIAILGGLMQDSLDNNSTGVPGLSRLPGIRNLFTLRDDTATKTELIIFIRPVVVRQASLEGDLERYRDYLPENGLDINDS